ncbi:MAG: hypothetical protein WKF37_20725 [Bryobacteraceae bacterium]
METLRRAAVYSSKHPAAGLELAIYSWLVRLRRSKGQNNSLALFDAGYFVESMKQIAHMSSPRPFQTLTDATGPSGSARTSG